MTSSGRATATRYCTDYCNRLGPNPCIKATRVLQPRAEVWAGTDKKDMQKKHTQGREYSLGLHKNLCGFVLLCGGWQKQLDTYLRNIQDPGVLTCLWAEAVVRVLFWTQMLVVCRQLYFQHYRLLLICAVTSGMTWARPRCQKEPGIRGTLL